MPAPPFNNQEVCKHDMTKILYLVLRSATPARDEQSTCITKTLSPWESILRGERVPCWLVWAVFFFSASLVSAGPAEYSQPSQTIQSSPETSPWEVRIGIPGWIPTISGDFGVRNVTSDVDINVLDHLDQLDAIFVLSAYVRYQRWEVFGDGFYVKVSDNVTVPRLLSAGADLSLKSGFAQGFLGYRVINSSKGYLSLFAGARYNYMGGDFHIFDNGDPRFPMLRMALGIPDNLRVSGSRSWVDPVVGLKGKVQVWKPISLFIKGDVGGFDVNSGTTYAVNGGVEFQITRWLWLQTGWAYLKNDYSSGGFSNKTELSGPLVQLGVNF